MLAEDLHPETLIDAKMIRRQVPALIISGMARCMRAKMAVSRDIVNAAINKEIGDSIIPGLEKGSKKNQVADKQHQPEGIIPIFFYWGHLE